MYRAFLITKLYAYIKDSNIIQCLLHSCTIPAKKFKKLCPLLSEIGEVK